MGILKSIGKAIGSVASPLVSGAFGIGSSLLGSISQNKTNKTNMQIAQMNNQWSEKMMEKQHLYDIEMMNRNNEYNSASAQVQRLKDAGLNPSMAMNGGATSGISQGGNSVGLPSPSSPNIQPVRYEGFANAISNTVQQMMALEKNRAEVYSLKQNSDTQKALAEANIKEIEERARSEKVRAEINEITKDLQISRMNDQWLMEVEQRYLVKEQQKLVQQQTMAQELINKNLPEKLSMEVAVMASTRDLNKFNAQHDVGKLIETLKKRGYKLSKAQENAIFEAVISKVENEANIIGSPWQLIGNGISAAKRIKTKMSD